MKINFIYGSRALVLPGARLLDKIRDASVEDLRVLICLCALADNSGECSLDETVKAAGCTRAELDASLHFWRGAGVIEFDTQTSHQKNDKKPAEAKKTEKAAIRPENRMPEYTSEQIVGLIDGNVEMANLIDECNRTFGKVLNTAEINTVIGLRDYLGLDGEYILILLAYCAKKGKKSLKYVEKMAFTLYENEIDNTAALEEYLKKAELAEASEGKLRKLFGMKSRALTPKEKQCFLRWSGEWGFDIPVIERAYEITINSINEPSVPYANKILEKWHDAGYKTLEEINAAITEYSAKKSSETQQAGSFDTDDFFELALRRSYAEDK